MFVLTRRSVPHIDMGTEPPLAHIGAVNPSSDARGNFQTTFAAFRTVFNALCRETNADPGAPRVGPPHRREDLGGLSGHLDQNFRRLDRESQVRAGLPAGGRRIRTLSVPRHDELGASGRARNADQSRGREAHDGEPGVTSSGRVISAYRGRRRRFGNQTTGHRGTSLRPARIVWQN